MEIDLNMSSIMPMLGFLRDLKNGQADRKQISDIFNHSDYDFEFRRYEVASKENIIDYFMRINTITESEIPILNQERKTALIDRHTLWLSAYENPEQYEILYDKINSFITDKILDDICAQVKRGLPTDIDIGKIRIISTMSIGPSFGYVFDGALHFDIMGYGYALDASKKIMYNKGYGISKNTYGI